MSTQEDRFRLESSMRGTRMRQFRTPRSTVRLTKPLKIKGLNLGLGYCALSRVRRFLHIVLDFASKRISM